MLQTLALTTTMKKFLKRQKESKNRKREKKIQWGYINSKSRLSKSGLYFKSKGNSKIETRKIAIKIEGFYSRTFVEWI